MIYLSKILVIGPVAVDMWHVGTTESNPDGNYPLLKERQPTIAQSGCAGSVAVNLARLGNEVSLFATNPKKAPYATEPDWFLEAPELYRYGVRSATPFATVNSSSLKERYLNKDFTPLLRIDQAYLGSYYFGATLEQLITATEGSCDAIYIADYEAYTLEDGIASAKTLGEYCDWLNKYYKGITISDSRRVVYNTQYVKTNKTEWRQILNKKAWHLNQEFIVSAGQDGASLYTTHHHTIPKFYCAADKHPPKKATISTCGAGDVITSVFLDRILKGFDRECSLSAATYYASESTTRPYTCRVSLKAAL